MRGPGDDVGSLGWPELGARKLGVSRWETLRRCKIVFSLLFNFQKLSFQMVKKPSNERVLLYYLHLSLGRILFFISLTCSPVYSFEQQFIAEIPGLSSEGNHSGFSTLSLDEGAECWKKLKLTIVLNWL